MIMQEYTHGYKYIFLFKILVPALSGNFCNPPLDQLSYGTIYTFRSVLKKFVNIQLYVTE